MTVNILGREYSIYTRSRAEDAKLKEYDGYCDYSVGEIVTVQREDDPMNMRDQDAVDKRILRHEIIHAFAASFVGAVFACLYRAGAGLKERLRRYSGLPRRTGNRGG